MGAHELLLLLCDLLSTVYFLVMCEFILDLLVQFVVTKVGGWTVGSIEWCYLANVYTCRLKIRSA